MRQRVSTGQQEGDEMRVEEEIALRWRVPWPLPAAPALRLRVASGLAVRGTATPHTPRLRPHTHPGCHPTHTGCHPTY